MTIPLTEIFDQELTLQADRMGNWLILSPFLSSGPSPSLYIQSPDDQKAVADLLIIEGGMEDGEWIPLREFLERVDLDTWSWPVRMTRTNWESYIDPSNYSDET